MKTARRLRRWVAPAPRFLHRALAYNSPAASGETADAGSYLAHGARHHADDPKIRFLLD
jgi:hypothetical protein